jgi:hypothetical protein
MRHLFKKKSENHSFRYYLSLCASIKDEKPYLLEWIEYHRMQGVVHIYLYDNNSTDHPKDILEYYIRKGIVTYLPWPDHPYGQLSAYNHCIDQFKTESFWIGFIDLDEFIAPLGTKKITQFLIDYEGTNGLGVNWIIYGSSGRKRKPEGLTIENYNHHAHIDFLDNRHLKIIADPRKVKNIWNQHCFTYLDGSSVLDENMSPIPPIPLSEKAHVSKIRINHYFTRSEEESVKKRLKGKTDGEIREQEIFSSLDRNEVRDDMMQQYIPQVKKRVHRILRLNERHRRMEAYLSVLRVFLSRLVMSKNSREISRDFDWKSYVNHYPDLQRGGINSRRKAIKHWREFGREEGRTYQYAASATADKPIKSGEKEAKIS